MHNSVLAANLQQQIHQWLLPEFSTWWQIINVELRLGSFTG